MAKWRLSPIAREDDPHWKDYEYKRPLIVEAEAASAARLKATDWYKEQYQGDADQTIRQFHRSAFEDEKLYEAIRLTSDTYEEEKDKYPVVK